MVFDFVNLNLVGALHFSAAAMTYVNLQLNPERYSGYAGPLAQRIWTTVYKENCPQC